MKMSGWLWSSHLVLAALLHVKILVGSLVMLLQLHQQVLQELSRVQYCRSGIDDPLWQKTQTNCQLSCFHARLSNQYWRHSHHPLGKMLLSAQDRRPRAP
jgi:hypothetical protein